MKLPFLLFAALFICPSIYAQPAALTTGHLDHIDSATLEERRPLYIHLPDGYALSTNRYPVLYILDGEWHFRKVVGIVDHLSSSGLIPEMIVVGIPNTVRAGKPSRLADLAPAMTGAPENGAANFLQFITDELIPFIENKHRTHPHRTIMGHSLGGLFAVYAMTERPNDFTGYLAISPSLGRNNQQEVHKAASFLSSRSSLKKTLALVIGNEGGNTWIGTDALVQVLKQSAPDDLAWVFNHMKDEDHVSIVHKGVYDALTFVFDGWQIDEALLTDHDVSIVERHYDALSSRLGFDIPVPELYYTTLGYRILAELEFDYAIWTFNQYKEAYPTSAEAHVGLADVHLMQGNLETAHQHYTDALVLDKNNERALWMSKSLSSH